LTKQFFPSCRNLTFFHKFSNTLYPNKYMCTLVPLNKSSYQIMH